MDESKKRDKSFEKWYNRTPWIVALLLTFWPVGLILMWKSSWPVVIKVIASVFVAVSVYAVWNMNQVVVATAL